MMLMTLSELKSAMGRRKAPPTAQRSPPDAPPKRAASLWLAPATLVAVAVGVVLARLPSAALRGVERQVAVGRQLFERGAWAASEDLPGGAPRAGAATARPSTAPLAVRLSRVKGTHLTPLTQDIFLPASKVADYAATATAVDPLIAAPRGTFLRQVDDAFAELDAWLAGTEAAK